MDSWIIPTVIVAIVSLLWNIANTAFTSSSNKKNKTRLVNLEEFRARVRDPLEASLRRGEAIVRELSHLLDQTNLPVDFEGSLVSINQQLMRSMSEIQDGLMDADESRFAAEFNWLDLYDPAEDNMMTHMNGVLDREDVMPSRKENARLCKSEFRKFKKAIMRKIDDEVLRLAR